MNENLAQKKCKPCELGEGKLSTPDVEAFLTHVPLWTVENNERIWRELKFKNFIEALTFVDKVGALAQFEGHHPDVSFGWGYAKISLSTHAVKGLSENDFILATKIDLLS